MMSTEAQQHNGDPGKAVGNAFGVALSWFLRFLDDKSALAVFAIMLLCVFGWLTWHMATEIVPSHLKMINDGYRDLAVEHRQIEKANNDAADSRLEKTIAAMKENAAKHEAHVNQIIEILREDRKPIPVGPVGGGS